MVWRGDARWRAGVVGVVEAGDRHPAVGWAAATLGMSLVVCGLGSMLGWLWAYLLSPVPIFWIIAVVAAVTVSALVIACGVLIADLPERWFGLSRWRSRGIAYAALVCGLLPWLIPHGPSFNRAGEAASWSVAFYAAGVLVLPATALLLVPGRRRSRAIGAVCLLVAATVWLPARHEWLAAETRTTLQGLGSPPRPLLRLVDWDGTVTSGVTYRDGRTLVDYDVAAPIPSPDGSHVATLITEPLPAGDDSSLPCREGITAERRLAGSGSTGPDPLTTCHQTGPQEWQASERTVVLRSDGFLVVLVADTDPGEFGSPATLLSVLHSQHIATDAEIRELGTT